MERIQRADELTGELRSVTVVTPPPPAKRSSEVIDVASDKFWKQLCRVGGSASGSGNPGATTATSSAVSSTVAAVDENLVQQNTGAADDKNLVDQNTGGGGIEGQQNTEDSEDENLVQQNTAAAEDKNQGEQNTGGTEDKNLGQQNTEDSEDENLVQQNTAAAEDKKQGEQNTGGTEDKNLGQQNTRPAEDENLGQQNTDAENLGEHGMLDAETEMAMIAELETQLVDSQHASRGPGSDAFAEHLDKLATDDTRDAVDGTGSEGNPNSLGREDHDDDDDAINPEYGTSDMEDDNGLAVPSWRQWAKAALYHFMIISQSDAEHNQPAKSDIIFNDDRAILEEELVRRKLELIEKSAKKEKSDDPDAAPMAESTAVKASDKWMSLHQSMAEQCLNLCQ
eukprot:s6941_g3.t1